MFFDLVVVNLYPFKETVENSSNEEEILDQFDIGGHSLIRASVKNYRYISILTNPDQYGDFIEQKIDNKTLAKKAIAYVMKYDMEINNWFNEDVQAIVYTKSQDLKYGLNPYMKPACIMTKNDSPPPFEILNGKIGYINLLDIQYAIRLVLEIKSQLGRNCSASFKHNSPAGVSLSEINTIITARNIDKKSSFGDIISYSGKVTIEMAEYLKSQVSDGIVAYDYEEDALRLLKEKKKGNYLIVKQQKIIDGLEYRDVNGVTLCQPSNSSKLNTNILDGLSYQVQKNMILGYVTLKYTQSNCICFVWNEKVIGIGAGQQNRVDCVKIAGEKAKKFFEEKSIYNPSNIVLISDAFFPFSDNIEVAALYGVDYILQPGGSIRDKEIEASCKKYNITMIYSNLRIIYTLK